MNWKTTGKLFFAFIVLALAQSAFAQFQFTAETGGKGSQSLLFSANAVQPNNFTTMGNFWTAYTTGVHNKVDAFALYGNITAFGQTQHYWGGGSNISLLNRKQVGFDASFFNMATMPFNKQGKSSTALVLIGPIVSRPLNRTKSLVLYGGILSTIPVGQRSDKLFTPSTPVNVGSVGLVTRLSSNVQLMTEYNQGPNQKNLGVGLLWILPNF
ncbi:MAG TPA: hypothetical protein VJH71_00205 [Candidatus Paceibacterota bacterium]